MVVEELIEYLKNCNPNLEICVVYKGDKFSDACPISDIVQIEHKGSDKHNKYNGVYLIEQL